MAATKCNECGLVNFQSAENCKRCNASLTAPAPPAALNASPAEIPLRSIGDPREEIVPYETKRRIVLSPLRILVIVLLIIGAVWYQINRDDSARAAQAKADKEFNDKRRIEDEKAHMGNESH